jgi:choline dehydrogenase-like flavoprotein
LIAVIGSGPAGVSAARALVARGQRVILFDGGEQLEEQRQTEVDALASAPPEQWSEATLDSIRGASDVGVGGVPEKLTYGSNFPYARVEQMIPFENHGSATRPTLARGGFSTVWGSCVLPYADADLSSWPISARDLAPHYRAVTGFMPYSAEADDLADEFPLYSDGPQPLQHSRQARSLMHDLQRARGRLAGQGLRFGWSRLAARAHTTASGPGCAYCGLCMYGCPYHLIYDASTTLAQLIEEGPIEYRRGAIVERIEERSGSVTLQVRDIETGERTAATAERAYVACGPISTTRLLLASLDCYDRAVTLRDSQYFLLPWLRSRGTPGAREEALHTLCQIFLELRDPRIDAHNIHLQVYSYNDLYARLFDQLLGPFRGVGKPAADFLLNRMLLIQGYLHSDASPSIRATLTQRDKGGVLRLEEQRNPQTRPAIRRVISRLLKLAPALRAAPLFPALNVAPAGRGFHSGGSFPMRVQPGELECDLLGRPYGLERVHLVDSSTFPSIPSTTITFTVMANAHRIASAEV